MRRLRSQESDLGVGFFVDLPPSPFFYLLPWGETRAGFKGCDSAGTRGRAWNPQGKPPGEREREGLLRFASSESQRDYKVC